MVKMNLMKMFKTFKRKKSGVQLAIEEALKNRPPEGTKAVIRGFPQEFIDRFREK